MIRKLLAPVLLVAAATGCAWENAHDYQELPPITRLTTKPTPAMVEIPELNVRIPTPANLPETVDEDTKILISKNGRVLFEGPLGDLTQVAAGHYHFERR